MVEHLSPKEGVVEDDVKFALFLSGKLEKILCTKLHLLPLGSKTRKTMQFQKCSRKTSRESLAYNPFVKCTGNGIIELSTNKPPPPPPLSLEKQPNLVRIIMVIIHQ